MSGTGAAVNATTKKVGRNDPCPCGSGRKFKHCCQARESGAGSPAEKVSDSATKQRLRALFLAAEKHWDAGRLAEAIPLFKEITRLDPNSPQAHHDLGVALLRGGRTAEAAGSLQRAVELRPGFVSALRHLVDALEPEGREAEALVACRKLSRVADDPIERRCYLAKALVFEGKLEEAEAELRRARLLAPGHASPRVMLGQLLSDRGMFEEAERHLTQAIGVVPNAFQMLTSVRRITAADRPLVDRMRDLAIGPNLEFTPRISVLFGLGKAFDDLGDYAEAMRHYDAGNRLKAMSMRLDREALVARYDEIIGSFTAKLLAHAGQSLARPACPGDDLPVFIVGMPRSGTTLTEQILSSHPAIAAAGELSFWKQRFHGWRAAGVRSLGVDQLAKAAEDYRAELRRVGPKALRVTDKAPRNFELLWLIRLAFPDARIIHCRRHPVDTCLSNYFTYFVGRQDYAYDRGDLVFFYRQYERLMDHWRSVLPPDRFTEVQYETLVADREAETRRLVAFCGLDWDEACLAPERNPRVVHTASHWQARQPVYKTSVERWRRYESWLGELRELLD